MARPRLPEDATMPDSWSYPGSRWWKFDFHAHSPASMDYGRNVPEEAALKRMEPRDWLLGFMREGIDCVAVADHNSGAWVDPLKRALGELERDKPQGFRELHLFPGVELSVNGGFHLLALFDTDKSTADVDRLLVRVGYDGNPGDSDVVTRRSGIEVVEAVLRAGGIPIPAHTDARKGLLQLKVGGSTGTALDQNSVGMILECPEILAMEVSDPNSARPQVYLDLKIAWTEVLGSDSHHPSCETGPKYPGSHYTWVKMAKPSLQGLRLALLDGGLFSIRRSDAPEPFDPTRLPQHFVEEIKIEDARYMGQGEAAKLRFSPWLNALVGGRGTGKSTVVHAMRLTARRGRELESLEERSASRLTFQRFNRAPSDSAQEGGLTANTKIRLSLMRDGVLHRVNWSANGDGPAVEEESAPGEWKPSDAQAVTAERFPMRMFSQGQIAELSGENQEALLQVIDAAAGVAPLNDKLQDARKAYYATRAKIRELDSKLAQRDVLTIELQDVERKLARFEAEGYADVLKAYRRRDRQRREAERQFDLAEESAQRVEGAASEIQPEDLPDGLFDRDLEEDAAIVKAMDALGAVMDTAAQKLRDAAHRLRSSAKTQREALTRSAWQAAVDRASGEYDRLVKALQEEGVTDLNEYGRLVQDKQRLDGEMKVLESHEGERAGLIEASQEQLKDVLEARRAMSRARSEFLSDTLAQNNFVRIEIHSYGHDMRVVERSLREALGVTGDSFRNDILVMGEGCPKGCVADLLLPRPRDGAEFESRLDELKSRFESACAGQGDFGGRLNNHLSREFQQDASFLDRLLTWFPEDGLNVRYSRGGDGKDFRPISQGSAGQRAAAMLAFLLAHGEEPLVLDQPEDDLDNQLIYDLVVRQIQENKLRRQIIVVTHNPNIVVNGDAEMVHALEVPRQQCVVGQSGTLQEEDMRERICQIMEGGREAFARRYRRLGPG